MINHKFISFSAVQIYDISYIHVLFMSFVIGWSDYFGFGFTTFNWKPLYSNAWLRLIVLILLLFYWHSGSCHGRRHTPPFSADTRPVCESVDSSAVCHGHSPRTFVLHKDTCFGDPKKSEVEHLINTNFWLSRCKIGSIRITKHKHKWRNYEMAITNEGYG